MIEETVGYINVEGGKLGYRLCLPEDIDFRNNTTLCVMHGGPGGVHDGQYKTLKELAETRPVLFYDQLGAGLSACDVPPELMTIERCVAEFEVLVSELGINEFVLLGHSWGGSVAIDYTLKNPETVVGLILSSPLISSKRWCEDTRRLLGSLSPEYVEILTKAEETGVKSPEAEEAERLFYRNFFYRVDEYPPEVVEVSKKTNRAIYNTMWGPSEFSCQGTLKNYDRFADLHNITCPSLLVCGQYDEATPETMHDAAKLMPDAKVVVVPEAAHMTSRENPTFYKGALKDFLEQF